MSTDDFQQDSDLTISWVSYVLHLVVAVGAVIPGGQVGPLLLVVALIIDLVKRGDVQGWQRSHFGYRLRTVLWAALLYLLTAPLWALFFFPGWLAWVVISIWFLYRVVLGMVRLNRGQAMPDPSAV
ncbi:DUF4870 family protein [Limnohabitans radicicola]|uniref:Transmembrane protein n=1 Tax=Limnohabitans radicicola TaxID=2771427 RepID=A0A927IKB1_9BURK|nr:hypothetical protein [Limnohabitans radicicola]MBD8049433.1 hypothetical protein [Limnohabitans radicicola]